MTNQSSRVRDLQNMLVSQSIKIGTTWNTNTDLLYYSRLEIWRVTPILSQYSRVSETVEQVSHVLLRVKKIFYRSTIILIWISPTQVLRVSGVKLTCCTFVAYSGRGFVPASWRRKSLHSVAGTRGSTPQSHPNN